jgi:hypothetical protein
MVIQYRAPWSVPNAGPSVSTFHFNGDVVTNPTALAAAVRLFFDGIKSTLPNDVIVSFASEFTVHNTGTGELTGTVPVTPPLAVQGTGTGSWAGGAGYRVDWLTPFVRAGRRVRGRTFIVPASNTVFSTEGRVLGATGTTANVAGGAMMSAASAAGNDLAVWSRATDSLTGATFEVTNAATSTLAATLRGRKY